MITPYRTESSIDKYDPKRFGLIKKTDPNPWKALFVFGYLFYGAFSFFKEVWNQHRCGYPKSLTRLWNWLAGHPFAEGSLYRCSCGKVWRSWYSGDWHTETHYTDYWLKAGGELEPEHPAQPPT